MTPERSEGRAINSMAEEVRSVDRPACAGRVCFSYLAFLSLAFLLGCAVLYTFRYERWLWLR